MMSSSFLNSIYFTANQGGVAHISTVGRSATTVKPKVSGQFEIFSKVNSQATTFFFYVYSQIGQGSSEILAIKFTTRV